MLSNVKVREMAGSANAMDSFSPTSVVRFGAFELDAAAYELRENGAPRKLPRQPCKVLILLTERAGQLVTRQEIRQCLWGDRSHVEVDDRINFCMNQIRQALRDPAERSEYIKTIPRQGYRFVAATTLVGESAASHSMATAGAMQNSQSAAYFAKGAIVLLMLFALPIAGSSIGIEHKSALVEKDLIVVEDFTNVTGDAVFDDTLKQALIIAMRQSPVFDVLPQAKALRTLRMMGQPDNARVTPDVGRHLCLRTGSKAALEGSIAALGSHYVVAINAVDCNGGDVLANQQEDVARKEDVLRALSQSALRLRGALGESLPSVHKFDSPLEATTVSLEALKNFSVGMRVNHLQGDAPSMAFFQRAIELDPSFSYAYAALSSTYNNLGQPSMALRYATKAYEFRDRGTERERLVTETRYLRFRGEMEKLTQAAEMWKSEYPHDAGPYVEMGADYAMMGQYQKSIAEFQEALRLQPDSVLMYDNLGSVYLSAGRPSETEALVKAALARQLDGGGLRWTIYHLAFYLRDADNMRRQLDWAIGKPGSEDVMLALQSDSEAYFGRLNSAREFSKRAIDAAARAGFQEAAALWQVAAALREAEFGYPAAAQTSVSKALAIATGIHVRVLAALALARAGDIDAAANITDDLATQQPYNTAIATLRLPAIRAAIALARGDAREALSSLGPTTQYELGRPSPAGVATLYPVYLKGLAYLALHRGGDAAIEFQMILDHPGIALNSPLGVLAHLYLGRAWAMAQNPSRAAAAYRDFLTEWQTADPEDPTLSRAKAEYAALK